MMKKPIVFMFSGQGSQYYQMGRELYENHPRFAFWMDHCSDITRGLIHASLIDIIYNTGKKSESFDRLLYTNPALLAIEYSLARMLMEMGIKPDYLLGYSFGEIVATVVSGAVSLEDGLRFAVDYAALVEKASPPAGMLAILAPPEIMEQLPGAFQNCRLTGNNFHNHFVVSGLIQDIHHLHSALNAKNIISQMLPVNYAFHTDLMNPLENDFKNIARRITLTPLRIPVISALKSGHLLDVDSEYFWDIIRFSVRFDQTIANLLAQQDYIFIDAGPSGTLATFIKYLLPPGSASIHAEVINQFGKDLVSLQKLQSKLEADRYNAVATL